MIKNKKFAIGIFSFDVYSASIVGICFLILVSLGNWQLSRRGQKLDFISNIRSNIAGDPNYMESFNGEIPLYSKIHTKGIFLENKNVFLYGRRSHSQEKDGYYLISAFVAEDGRVYAVSRGWISQSVKEKTVDFLPKKGFIEINAITLPNEHKNFMVPDNDSEQNIWFTLDLENDKSLGLTQREFYLFEIESEHLPEGVIPLNPSNLDKVKNDHLEYAITWYLLAFLGLIIYLINCKKKS